MTLLRAEQLGKHYGETPVFSHVNFTVEPGEFVIERGANAWLKLLKTRNLPWRFDVIEILLEEGEKPKINHVKDAF